MRITDARYDRDRTRLSLAYRLIAHEARTRTIRIATGLSDDRIRKLFREYLRGDPACAIRRRRGRSPRQMSYFLRSPMHELQTAMLACMLQACGLLSCLDLFRRPAPADVDRLCDVFETYQILCPKALISFEHAWYLTEVLTRRDEYVLAACPECGAFWVRDTLSIIPDNCPACRWTTVPGPS